MDTKQCLSISNPRLNNQLLGSCIEPANTFNSFHTQSIEWSVTRRDARCTFERVQPHLTRSQN